MMRNNCMRVEQYERIHNSGSNKFHAGWDS